MSLEEEIELKDLIAQTLKSNGTLAKIKAQLRASIFLALDEDEKISKQTPLLNNNIKNFMDSDEGKAMFYIVHEFLEFFKLYFTLAVYEPESYIACDYQQEEKQRLLNQFGLGNIGERNEPLLYQLLKIAQSSKRNLEVNISGNKNLHQEHKSESLHSESESVSVPGNICSHRIIAEELIEVDTSPTPHLLKEPNFNTTFDVHSPLLSKIITHDNQLSCQNKEKSIGSDNSFSKTPNDDTSEDTSSLPDEMDLSNANSNNKVPDIKLNGVEVIESVKEKCNDKPKLSPPKSEKLKSKCNLSSLSDLPPLNKPRVNDILPSLYNKDFKDKSNLRELDKLFDMDAEYEEDFMYSGDDLSLRSDHSRINLLDELQSNKTNKDKTAVLGKKEVTSKNPSKIIGDCKFKGPVNAQRNKTINDSSEVNCITDNLGTTSD